MVDHIHPFHYEIISAETPTGCNAIETIMRNSYSADIDSVPKEWALALLANNEPVSYVLIDTERYLTFPGRKVRYAYIGNTATRKEDQRKGHFRALLSMIFDRLRAAGFSMVLLHGSYYLYKPYDFTPFTHHSGIFISPDQINRQLGGEPPAHGQKLFYSEQSNLFRQNLLVISNLKARDYQEARAVLQAASAMASEYNKSTIFFEHPFAPSYGSTYPIYPSPETRFTQLARTCGAQVILCGSDPESRPNYEADLIKLLDAPAFLRQTIAGRLPRPVTLAETIYVSFVTEIGAATLESDGSHIQINDGTRPDATLINIPAQALAQLVLGYISIPVMCALYNINLPEHLLAFLSSLFPPLWRFSRNITWLYTENYSADPNA